MRRFKPSKRSATAGKQSLADAYASSIKEKTGKNPLPIDLQDNYPQELGPLFNKAVEGDPESAVKLLQQFDPNTFGSIRPGGVVDSSGNFDVTKGPVKQFQINHNPNGPEEVLAHELGHAVNYQTKFGNELMKMRLNPKLAQATAMAGGLSAIAAAGLTPGDNDLDEAIIGTMALNAPTLIDEAMASRNALDLMNRAGRPANLGQKARLAGGFMSYLGAMAGSATLANTLGNQFDEDV